VPISKEEPQALKYVQVAPVPQGSDLPAKSGRHTVMPMALSPTKDTGKSLAVTLLTPLQLSDFYSISATNVDFGGITLPRHNKLPTEPAKQSISITNYTAGAVTVSWQQINSKKSEFFVSPARGEIAAGESATFDICFLPSVLSHFFSSEVECFINFTDMFKEDSVGDTFFSIPYCFSVSVTGHSYGETTPAPPQVSFSAESLVFPVGVVNSPVFETLTLTNKGDTSVKFEFHVPDVATWSVLPKHGILPPHSEQFLVFQVTPDSTGPYSHIAQCFLNNSHDPSKIIHLTGCAERPSLLFEDGSTLYFPPTSVGLSSTVPYLLQNASALYINFVWKIPSETSRYVTIVPSRGVLRPFETVRLLGTFRPFAVSTYSTKISCIYSPIDMESFVVAPPNLALGRPSREQAEVDKRASEIENFPKSQFKMPLLIVAEAVIGEIISTEAKVDMSTIVVGVTHRRNVTIKNPTFAALKYKLSVTLPNVVSINKTEVC
jgi:hypothetical protein